MRDFMEDKVGYMSLDLYKKIFEKHIPESIKLNWRGEPFLNKSIIKMVEYAKSKGVQEVSINTNGLLLSEGMLHALSWAGLDWLIFSVDSVDPRTYEKIRVGGDFLKLVKNIIRARIVFDSIPNAPSIRIQMCKQPANIHEVQEWKKMFGVYADKLRIGKLHDPQGKRGYSMKLPNGCSSLWQRLVIDWQGNICLCPGDFLRKVDLGNITDAGIREAWNSIKLKGLRILMATKGRKSIPLCDKCTSYC